MVRWHFNNYEQNKFQAPLSSLYKMESACKLLAYCDVEVPNNIIAFVVVVVLVAAAAAVAANKRNDKVVNPDLDRNTCVKRL